MTAAADEFVVTQPSVSSAIAALSRELGCELFERAGRGIRLTDAGLAFRPYAEDVVGLLDDGRHAAREAADVAARRMRIAAVTTAAESFVPPLMRVFASRHPDVELTLDVGNREYVFERVLSHLADVAISGKPPADERLVAEPLLENHIVCITGARRPAGRGRPGRGGRARAPRLVAPRAGVGHARARRAVPRGSRSAPEHAHARLQRRDQAGGPRRSRRLAAVAGRGRARADGGWLGQITLNDGPEPRPWFVLRSAVGPVRPAAATFIEFVRAEAAELGSPASRDRHIETSICGREIRT